MEEFLSPEQIRARAAEEIKRMCAVDQDMREQNLESGDEYWDEDVDLKNTERMRAIVEQIGWPTISKVGADASSDAWLLVQHSDRDVEFQMYCLELMKAAPDGDVDKHDIVYLEDRIRVNQGRGQIYGTQFRQEKENKQHIPLPIEDEENVDKRRAEMGMGPLSEQIETMYEKYPFDEDKSKIK